MAPRFTEAEKGKGTMVTTRDNPIRRIRAPSLDTSALIIENALTLIGKLTNPQEQKIWALIPALPQKWNLLGRAVGSDLGNNCFMFRFEREDDFRRVLDNRPYHFSYWMIILQRWEPVISSSFPSLIPFWIRIKGLPLHFWHEKMVAKIGQDLGTLETHELTKTTARVRVLIGGLKPLIKKAVIEFDSGEESLINLEYEKLESHCSICYSLFHARRNCPEREQLEESSERIPDNRGYVSVQKIALRNATTEFSTQGEMRKEKPSTDLYGFHERFDRYGRPFGERVSTKHTRVPPPLRSSNAIEPSTQTWKQKTTKGDSQPYVSPQYTHKKTEYKRLLSKGKGPVPPKKPRPMETGAIWGRCWEL
ncbi:hypothetical protein Bca4012_065679 [Brassica carinata]|uniref:DUF4283 domain-containing protein n=1 Tax=Brassica carinata TaxID=52824 RepID=A0A8X7VN30_BRACI|nr:hypothetical protein Bca52824_017990 [Brassica carinata]